MTATNRGELTMKNLITITVFMLLITGCSIAAPKYNTDFNNISLMRKEKIIPVKVGSVTKNNTANEDVDSLSIRGGSFNSPYGSYTAYLSEALKQELDDARLFDPTSQIEVSAVLLRNSIDASGISQGIAEIEARFMVYNAGKLKYDKVKSARHTWGSSFAGAIAIPLAQQNYPIVVQKLVGSLFFDQEFISALK